MNRLLMAFACCTVVACASRKEFRAQSAVLESGCGPSGSCTIAMQSGKSIRFTHDTLNAAYVLEDNPQKNVIVYQYNKTVKANLQDAAYREEIVLELDADATPTALKDAALQNAKVIFGRFCFCKGQTGYYPVSRGSLTIDASHKVSLRVMMAVVPQVTDSIAFRLE